MKILLPLLLAVSAHARANTTVTGDTIVDYVVGNPDLSTLVAALKAGDLVDTLSGAGPFTVFAPTNEAFAALPAGTVANLLKPENKAALVDILTFHVHSGTVYAKSITDGEKITTVEGNDLVAKVQGADVFINTAKVTIANQFASNGVTHVVDAVLLPPSKRSIVDVAANTPDLSTLVTALKAGDLVDTLSGAGPFTVFAPTNEAFAALPAGVLANLLKPENKAQLVDLLTYHVVSGAVLSKDIINGERLKTVEGKYVTATVNRTGVFINNAQVTTADVVATNGVVHIVDAVLAFPAPPPPPPAPSLWFRGFTQPLLVRCGEVDAGPRMPAAIFDQSKLKNEQALRAYEDITLALYGVYNVIGQKGDLGLELGRCADKNFTRSVGQAKNVNWAPVELMSGICKKQCNCNFCPVPGPCKAPQCVDEPDDPKAEKWCSLCGPKYNKPITVNLFNCGNKDETTCPGPDAQTPVADWARVVKDLLAIL